MKIRPSLFCVLILLAFCFMSCFIVDYVYRHDVEGVVTDSVGKPIPEVLVSRSLEGSGHNDHGAKQQSTDNLGRFEFYREEVAGKPKDKITWVLTLEHPEYQTQQVSIDLFWTKKKDDNVNYGYVKKDIVVQLTR